MRRSRRLAGVMAALAVAAPALVGCGSATSGSATDATAGSFAFGPCDSVADGQVATQLADVSLARTVTSPMGCQWESPTQTVRTWWYRGSPLSDARTRASADRRTVSDITVDGLRGLSARGGSGGCDVDVAAGTDVVVWSVDRGRPGVDACIAADALARTSVERGRRAGNAAATFGQPDESYPCGLADESTVAAQLAATGGSQVFDGDVCEWSLTGPAGPADALSSWFVADTLDREKAVTAALGYAATPLRVNRDQAITLRNPADPGACGVEVQTDSGTVGWWIAYRDRSALNQATAPDPCGAATALAKATLDLEP